MNKNNTCCENNTVQTCGHRTNNGFLIVIVLYILLAIILGSYLY